MAFLNNLGRAISQLPGFHTSRKIVVIESDDWGCIRTKDRASLSALSKTYPHVLQDPYNRFDTLECVDDLDALFQVLGSVRDKKGNPAVITANTIVANPDYENIKKDNYEKYSYITLQTQLADDPQRHGLLATIKQGMAARLYRPQLHGREHLNINQWLRALQGKHPELICAFKYEMFGVSLKQKINMRNNVMAAFDFENPDELNEHALIIDDAQRIFTRLFGFSSESFIAPTYIWHSELEHALRKSGMTSIQGLPYQYIPNPAGRWYKKKFRYTGKTSDSGITNLVRNVFFEPSLSPKVDVVDDCLRRIQLSFSLRKPAIIGSHRLNFIGGLDEENRINNLKALKQLLSTTIKKWPDVEFMASDELGKFLRHD